MTMPQPQPVQVEDRTLIDNVLYLASLASEPAKVDPLLDQLRIITSQWVPGTALQPAARSDLEELSRQIKQYLVTDDPLRNFSPETLEARIESKNQPPKKTASYWLIVVACLALAGIVLLVPATSLSVRFSLAIPVFLLVVALATTWFYLTSLSSFKPELKRAFLYLCAGNIGLGLQYIAFSAIALLKIGDRPALRYAGMPVIAAVSYFWIYFGIRAYARTLQIRTRFTSLQLLFAISTGLLAVVSALAYVSHTANAIWFVLSELDIIVIGISALFGARLAQIISAGLNTAYARSVRCLYYFLGIVALVAPPFSIIMYSHGSLTGDLLGALLGAFGAPPMLLVLYSGWSFKRETSR
ncbi:MAG: hypothetical protein ACQR33_00010 [Candidatus Saccharibacteria bacterium]